MESTLSPNLKVVFVLGGPGSGKGTQCSNLTRDYQHLHHLSIGDILREETLDPNSEFGEIIRQNIAEGRLGRPEMTLALLKRAMLQKGGEGAEVFLVDGFPRSVDRAILFESTICLPNMVLLLESPEDVMEERLLGRAATESRSDDTVEVIRKRFAVFSAQTGGVISHYEGQGKVKKIDASREVVVVYESVRAALGDLLVPSKLG